MNAAKARDQYQVALRLLSELRAVPFDSQRSPPKLAQLCRLVHSILSIASGIADKDSNAIWQQRSATLHKELVSLVRHVGESGEGGEERWDGFVRALLVGAEGVEKLEQEKESLLARLAAETQRRQHAERDWQESVKMRDAASKEILELRTKFVVHQQDFQRRDADARDLVRRLQHAVKERDALNSEKEFLDEKNSHNMQILERQADAISQLMVQVEDNTKQKEVALAALKRIEQDNHTLRVNLGQHAQVIENLIDINAEMMEAANNYSLLQEERRLSAQLQLQECSEDGNRPPGEPNNHHPLPLSAELSPTEIVPAVTEPPPAAAQEAPPDPSSQHLQTNAPAQQEGEESDAPSTNGTLTAEADAVSKASSSEKPQRRQVRWTSDMLPLSLKDISDLKKAEEKDDDASSLSRSFRASALLGKLDGVRGKAKGFLSFVTGADLAAAGTD